MVSECEAGIASASTQEMPLGSAETSAMPGGISFMVYPEYLFVREKYEFRRVAVADIECVVADRMYCTLYLTGGRRMVLSRPMKELLVHLSPLLFVRIHRSYMVNVSHIVAVKGRVVVMESGAQLCVSREHWDWLDNAFVYV